MGVVGFQISYVIFRGGMSNYLLFLTGVVWKIPKPPLYTIKMVLRTDSGVMKTIHSSSD